MRLTFHGAAREVTGSCHLLEVNGSRVLLDCGMIQGGKERHERNRANFPFDPRSIDCVVLSHAHIDHSGRLPLLVKRGFSGPIYATEPTVSLCTILLADSGHIQEEDARWKITRLEKAGEDATWVTPLYTEAEALAIIPRFTPVPFDTSLTLPGIGALRFHKAGHILGAAIVDLEVTNGRRVVFSGDLGVEGARLLSAPAIVTCPDYLLIESTYGDRDRVDNGDRTELLYRCIRTTIDRGGKVVIPAFAVGRTQELLARLNDLVEAGRLDGVPVYVDSPMAIEATRAFAVHPEAYSTEARRLLHAGDAPLDFQGLTLTRTVDESRAINDDRAPAVIISASGMCTAGRIKHHLKHNISDTRSTVLFVGYQARETLGRVIQSGVNPVRIHGEWFDVRARIETIDGFSAHADRGELLGWFEGLGGRPKRTHVVHGEEDVSLAFAQTLRERFDADVLVPRLGQSVELP